MLAIAAYENVLNNHELFIFDLSFCVHRMHRESFYPVQTIFIIPWSTIGCWWPEKVKYVNLRRVASRESFIGV